jgi:hypothetical protein
MTDEIVGPVFGSISALSSTLAREKAPFQPDFAH